MIKVVVFDFDDTLYNTDVWFKWSDFCNDAISKCLPHYTKKQTKKFIEKYNLTNECNGNAIAEALIKETGSDKAWEELRDGLYEEANCVKFVKNDIIKQFAEHFDLFIVSFSPIDFIKFYSKKYNFDLSPFKNILGNEKNLCDKNKKPVFEQILKENDIKPSEMCIIGGNYMRDIMPAKELKCHSIQVSNICEINENLLNIVKNM